MHQREEQKMLQTMLKNKNIYICGIPRSGKTTLARMIRERYSYYNELSFEAIRNTFISSFPDLEMNNRNSSARRDILPKFIVSLATWNSNMTGYPTLVEGDFTSVDILDGLTNDNSIIIVLGLGVIPIDKMVRGIRLNDDASSYTKDFSDKRLIMHFNDSMTRDNINYQYCINHNISYYNTYENREEVFEKILDDLKNNL